MIVYVESNFVLEIALGQEEAPAAETILELAEQNKLELCCPSFALSEPFATITQRGRKRKDLSKSLAGTIRELQRSKPHEEVVFELQPIPASLTNIVSKEFSLLQSTVKRLLSVSKLIELNGAIYEQAIAYRFFFGLSPQDSIIYASVISDLMHRDRKGPKYFISRNWKDFRDFSIKYELESYNCQYVENFNVGLNLIQSNSPS